MSSRYTAEQINAYQLETVLTDSGETTGYRVLIAGDWLGTIERVPFRTKAWQALDTNRATVPHVGHGRHATTREAAVVDLLAGLGVA